MSDPSRTIGCTCPRCNYDLRGTVAMWRDACPLNGTCTECGLEFEWAELLTDSYVVPPWCVESPRGLRRFPRQMAATVLRAYRPWRFWSALRMSHPIRWGRVGALVGIVTAALYGVFALLHGWVAWRDFCEFTLWGGVTPTTGREVFWGAVALPLARDPAWAWTTPWHVFHYVWMRLVFLLGAALIMHAGCALTFAALPVTRRRCKVRWAHIARVACYGLALFVPVLVASLLAFPVAARMGLWYSARGWLAGFAWLILPPAEVAWWAAATSRYLRMPHAWAVGFAVVLVGALLGLAITMWVGLLLPPP
jgi:hypothetical protein